MLSLVTAAEQQYRFDTASRAREHAVLRAIRDRDEAAAAETARAHVTRRAAPSSRPRPANAQRAAAVCASA